MDDYSRFTDPGRVRVRGATKRQSESLRLRRPSMAVVRAGNYTTADWEASSFGIFAEGADPPACPDCGRTGFFGPRFADPDVKLRSCRFCGFWQPAGGAPKKHLPTAHDCESWPQVSGAKYLWWVPPKLEGYTCPFCDGHVDVPLSILPAPNEDAAHPWWRVPQQESQSEYKRIWNQWAFSSGRTIL